MPQRCLAVSKAVLFLPLLSPWWTAALAAADPPSTPFWSTADKISAGDTAWMLTSTALVLLMTIPGLALFYAGMVRKKNLLSTALQSSVSYTHLRAHET